MVKVLCILYSGGKHAAEEKRLLGTIENKLGLEKELTSAGHQFVVTDDKEGPNSTMAKEIVDADVVITTPFHPGYLSREVIAKAKNLKLCITAGVGSDHVDLNAANERKITVAEVSGSNVVSVAEHVVMTILILVRNYNVGHEQISQNRDDGWLVAAIARDAYDLEDKVVGTIGAGRIGYRVLQRLVPFNCKELVYFDYQDLPADAAKQVGARRIGDFDEFLSHCDIITVNAPLHEGTRDLINKNNIYKMKKGAWLINTARGAICNAEAVADAVKSGHILGYGGDVWNYQPAPKDHPWRKMQNPHGGGNAMVPHYSGTTLDAQKRYADGTRDILNRWLSGQAQDPQNLIVENGEYATKAYGQRK